MLTNFAGKGVLSTGAHPKIDEGMRELKIGKNTWWRAVMRNILSGRDHCGGRARIPNGEVKTAPGQNEEARWHPHTWLLMNVYIYARPQIQSVDPTSKQKGILGKYSGCISLIYPIVFSTTPIYRPIYTKIRKVIAQPIIVISCCTTNPTPR
ncbi:uncharacterized protein BDR25DRAFT_354102 [Lindgomyces ingoldianus]|uniref:Uncharacterized protein n=1 Tax=Lindgomyces ingoldianus TaxID=673940 RepID=A0ACB6QZ84_9PLEO|nr:uncharacterized protein BDR25DRAFT_354102 [Lindgomyces ingoldianus]KAF2471582.1 hypothetical protein BDR25DRAFT_354102 [Lindgomyces ingoldianus]